MSKETSLKDVYKSIRVRDRFHVQKLTSEALQEIKYCWEAIDYENDAVEKVKRLTKKI